MKAKTRSPFQFDFEIPTADAQIVRTTVIDRDDGELQGRNALDSPVRWIDVPIACKPIEEIAVTLRRRADGMLHPCCCNGTGEDGCIVDDTLARANPQAGFASYSSAIKRGDHE